MSINKDIFLKKMLIDNNILSKGDIEKVVAEVPQEINENKIGEKIIKSSFFILTSFYFFL